MLLDFITVFCLVGGWLLLWLNLRPRRDQVIIAKSEPAAQPPKPSVEILLVPQEMQNNEPLRSEDKGCGRCRFADSMYSSSNWRHGGAYAPPLPNFQTGMPSFRALSARFS